MPTSITAFSYASAALAFLLFSVLVLTGWRQRLTSGRTSACWPALPC